MFCSNIHAASGVGLSWTLSHSLCHCQCIQVTRLKLDRGFLHRWQVKRLRPTLSNWVLLILTQRLRAAPWPEVGNFYYGQVIIFILFSLKCWLSSRTVLEKYTFLLLHFALQTSRTSREKHQPIHKEDYMPPNSENEYYFLQNPNGSALSDFLIEDLEQPIQLHFIHCLERTSGCFKRSYQLNGLNHSKRLE